MRRSMVCIILLFINLLLLLRCTTTEGPFDPTYWNEPFKGITFTDEVGNIIKEDPSDWCYLNDDNGNVSILSGDSLPMVFSVYPAYPNPSPKDGLVTLGFSIPQSSITTINIIDSDFNVIRTLVHSALSAGAYTIVWNKKNDFEEPIPSGVYRCYFQTENFFCQGDIWVK